MKFNLHRTLLNTQPKAGYLLYVFFWDHQRDSSPRQEQGLLYISLLLSINHFEGGLTVGKTLKYYYPTNISPVIQHQVHRNHCWPNRKWGEVSPIWQQTAMKNMAVLPHARKNEGRTLGWSLALIINVRYINIYWFTISRLAIFVKNFHYLLLSLD